MVRSQLTLVLIGVLWVTSAEAQPTPIAGMLSGQLGAVFGGETDKTGITPSGAIAILESNGWGAEIDAGHTFRVADEDTFEDSRVTTLMLNVLGSRPSGPVRPFGTAGIGLIRLRARRADIDQSVLRTDWGLNLGAGAFLMLNEISAVRVDLRYFRYLEHHGDLLLSDGDPFDFWRLSFGMTWGWPIR